MHFDPLDFCQTASTHGVPWLHSDSLSAREAGCTLRFRAPCADSVPFNPITARPEPETSSGVRLRSAAEVCKRSQSHISGQSRIFFHCC